MISDYKGRGGSVSSDFEWKSQLDFGGLEMDRFPYLMRIPISQMDVADK